LAQALAQVLTVPMQLNWGSAANPSPFSGGGNGTSLASAFCGARQEKEARPKMNRTLSDITNIAAQGLGINKRPSQDGFQLEPKTPQARRSKSSTSESGLAVFDESHENAQSVPRRPASPPHLRPKARDNDEDCILGYSRSRQMLGIEEVVQELPPIQDFADRVSEQEHSWEAFGCEDGPDGFGRPEDLARMLGEGTARACFESEGTSVLHWGDDLEGRGVASPDSLNSSELNRMVWPSLSPSPKRKLVADAGFSSSPLLLPAMDIDMDIDSGSDGERDGTMHR